MKTRFPMIRDYSTSKYMCCFWGIFLICSDARRCLTPCIPMYPWMTPSETEMSRVPLDFQSDFRPTASNVAPSCATLGGWSENFNSAGDHRGKTGGFKGKPLVCPWYLSFFSMKKSSDSWEIPRFFPCSISHHWHFPCATVVFVLPFPRWVEIYLSGKWTSNQSSIGFWAISPSKTTM